MARKEREVKEIVVSDDSNYIGSNLPVTQADFDNLSAQRKMLREFVKNQLVVNVDYGIIPNTPKPSLYKPGAEKLKMLFGLGVRNILQSKESDRKENYASYEYKAEVYHLKTDRVVADCVGVCNSQEVKYRERSIYKWNEQRRKKEFAGKEATPISDILNTLSKMAQKRAFVGAIIIATGASDFFTQDMEDYDDGPGVDIQNDDLPENKSQFADDDKTKKMKGLLEACRKVGISQEDIKKKYNVDDVMKLTEAQCTELANHGRAVQADPNKKKEIFNEGNV